MSKAGIVLLLLAVGLAGCAKTKPTETKPEFKEGGRLPPKPPTGR